MSADILTSFTGVPAPQTIAAEPHSAPSFKLTAEQEQFVKDMMTLLIQIHQGKRLPPKIEHMMLWGMGDMPPMAVMGKKNLELRPEVKAIVDEMLAQQKAQKQTFSERLLDFAYHPRR